MRKKIIFSGSILLLSGLLSAQNEIAPSFSPTRNKDTGSSGNSIKTERLEKHVIDSLSQTLSIYVKTDTLWDYSDTSRVTYRKIKELNILRDEDIPFFKSVIDIGSPLKWMLIPVDGFYWDSAGTVADKVLSLVKEDIDVWYAEFDIEKKRRTHKPIGYVLLINRNKTEPDLETLIREYKHMVNIIDIFAAQGIPKNEYKDLLFDVENLRSLIMVKGGAIPEKRRERGEENKIAERAETDKTFEWTVEQQFARRHAKEQVTDSVSSSDVPVYYVPKTRSFRSDYPIREEFIVENECPKGRKKNLRLRFGLTEIDDSKKGSFDARLSIRPFVLGAGVEGNIGTEGDIYLLLDMGFPIWRATVEGIAKGRIVTVSDDTTVTKLIGASENMFLISEISGSVEYVLSLSRLFDALVYWRMIYDLDSNKKFYEAELGMTAERVGVSIMFRRPLEQDAENETSSGSGLGIKLIIYP